MKFVSLSLAVCLCLSICLSLCLSVCYSRLEARGYVADEDVRVNIAINLAKHRDLTG